MRVILWSEPFPASWSLRPFPAFSMTSEINLIWSVGPTTVVIWGLVLLLSPWMPSVSMAWQIAPCCCSSATLPFYLLFSHLYFQSFGCSYCYILHSLWPVPGIDCADFLRGDQGFVLTTVPFSRDQSCNSKGSGKDSGVQIQDSSVVVGFLVQTLPSTVLEMFSGPSTRKLSWLVENSSSVLYFLMLSLYSFPNSVFGNLNDERYTELNPIPVGSLTCLWYLKHTSIGKTYCTTPWLLL